MPSVRHLLSINPYLHSQADVTVSHETSPLISLLRMEQDYHQTRPLLRLGRTVTGLARLSLDQATAVAGQDCYWIGPLLWLGRNVI